MKIAITGAGGFIGKHLIKRLRSNTDNTVEIIEIDRKNGFDITNREVLKSVPKFDVLCHLAAKVFVPLSYQQPYDFYNTNVVGTLNMLELCRENNAKMVFLSSYIYGTPNYLPIDENHSITSFNPYSNTKIISEQLCQGYNKDYNLPIIVLRPFNTYGLGQNENFLIPQIIQQAKTGKIELKDSRPKRDMVYIDDLVEAISKSIFYNKTNFETINIGFGKSFSVKDICDMVKDLSLNKIEISFSEEYRKSEVMDTIADIKKAKKILNWEPKISLREGLNKMIKEL